MIDGTDLSILKILQDNARTSNAEIARQIGMAPSAILERIRKLERKGIIQRYETRISPTALGKHLTAFTLVHTEEPVGSTGTGEELAKIPGVLEVHYVAGQDAYFVKSRTRDPEHLAELLKQFGRIKAIRDTRTTVVLTTVKETMNVPLESMPEGEPE
ncbi:transcriptional regulator [Desulfocurvibacter africanus PCS]|jgi:Lrp/AsnC family leucine-responsive transcriptional regulator|uniref:Transcriptional regulator n=1 Tax=Desulfocurvibacter africanus PCS TaxID=1262666 RepID=M5PPE6_DESAF|nr:Lrp/AsnC family transcriptional regulator [Desulfocurvibacter africanus]EMG35805.1 transcriptional regulator [Desulfocurvibacter africanus PCS]